MWGGCEVVGELGQELAFVLGIVGDVVDCPDDVAEALGFGGFGEPGQVGGLGLELQSLHFGFVME